MKRDIAELVTQACLVAAYDPTSWYYDLEPGTPIKEIVQRWAKHEPAQKAYDRSMPQFYAAKDLWPHREYTWTRDTARSGLAKVGNETVLLPGPLKWDALIEDMKKNGWDPKDPLHFEVGRNGKTKVGEGNHRLAIAKEIGLKKIPVVFHFKEKVAKSPPPKKDPVVEVEPKPLKKVIREPRGPISPQEQKQIDDLMDLLGF